MLVFISLFLRIRSVPDIRTSRQIADAALLLVPGGSHLPSSIRGVKTIRNPRSLKSAASSLIASGFPILNHSSSFNIALAFRSNPPTSLQLDRSINSPLSFNKR